jgi:diacylglycerol kinase family enzyme
MRKSVFQAAYCPPQKEVIAEMHMCHNLKHLFIVNPKSFWKKTKQNQVIFSSIHQFFEKIENKDYDIHISQFPRDAVGFIPLFAKDLPDTTTLRVYAVGVDGILFDCLNGIMGLKNVELAAIPYGHTNNFIRGFGKNEKYLFRQLSQQYDAPAIPIDVIRCGDYYALNYCVFGIEAEAIRQTEKIRERMENSNSLNKWLSRQLYTFLFFTGKLAALGNKRFLYQRYEVNIDGEGFNSAYQSISIFNSAYSSEFFHPPSNAMPNDGILDILAVRSAGSLQTFLQYPIYMSGKYQMFPLKFVLKQGKKISVRSENIVLLSIDGVMFFDHEFEIELLPAAIKFVDASRHGYKGSGGD